MGVEGPASGLELKGFHHMSRAVWLFQGREKKVRMQQGSSVRRNFRPGPPSRRPRSTVF